MSLKKKTLTTSEVSFEVLKQKAKQVNDEGLELQMILTVGSVNMNEMVTAERCITLRRKI
jgi:hypothetical protein